VRLESLLATGLAVYAPALLAQFPSEPPQPGPVVAFPLVPPKEVLLANGLRLLVVEQPRQPVISITLSMPAGTAFDPKDKEGTADLLGRLITRGAGERSAAELAAAIESVGGSLGAVTDPDALSIQADVLSSKAALAFDLIADMVLRPALDSAELMTAKQVVMATITTEPEDGSALASRVFLVGTYRQHPYARRPVPGSIASITRADLEAFRLARMRPAGSVLVIAGDITLAEAQRLATKALANWKGVRPPPLPVIIPAPAPPTIYLIHRGGAQTANIILGNTTFAGSDTTYYAAAVLNRILGEGRRSRMVRSLAEEHGWSLSTGSGFQRTARLGLFQATAEVPTQVADSTIREMKVQLEKLRTDLVPARELDRARESLSGEFTLRLQTMAQTAAALSQARMVGVPTSYLTAYRTRIGRVSAAAVRGVARRVFDPAMMTLVVAGDAARLYGPLSAMGSVRIFAPNGRPLLEKDITPTTGQLAFDVQRLQPRTDSLVIVAQGQPVGLQVAEISRGGDSVVYTERTSLGPQLNQITRLVFDSAGRMRRLDQTGRVRGHDTKIALTYGAGRVKGQAQVLDSIGSPRIVAVDTAIAPATIDDNALVALLPTLPWALNTRWTIPVFASGESRVRKVTLTVADIEPVRTPAGDFEAFRADLEGASQAVSFYVTTTAPYRLVRIALTGSPVEFLAISKP
jgi:predicted Zn-dependent peptidase